MALPEPEELTLLGLYGHPHAQVLNSLYEDAFPGLRYITFVNGRSRAEIVPELEVRVQSTAKLRSAGRSRGPLFLAPCK